MHSGNDAAGMPGARETRLWRVMGRSRHGSIYVFNHLKKRHLTRHLARAAKRKKFYRRGGKKITGLVKTRAARPQHAADLVLLQSSPLHLHPPLTMRGGKREG